MEPGGKIMKPSAHKKRVMVLTLQAHDKLDSRKNLQLKNIKKL